jgi:flagellar biosynthesis/type III secretory pathway protein FliH
MSVLSKILKGAAPLEGRRIPSAVHETDLYVRERVAAAEEEGRRIRAEADADRERVRAAAEAEGRREGLARAGATLAAAAADRDRRLAGAEREIVALALSVARKVLAREVAGGGPAVAELAALALAEARERREVTLRVHPVDIPAIRASEGSLRTLLMRAPLALREDPAVAPGGAVVETEAGRIDASIEAQLADIARVLDEVLA